MMETAQISACFDEYVDGWLLGDLRYCADQEKNLSFVVAMLAFNAIDFLGSLYKGEPASQKFFNQFVERYLSSYQPIGRLYDNYRCGLAHQFFPKLQHAIVWKRPGLHLKNAGGCWTINAQSLVADLERAIVSYKADVFRDVRLQESDFRSGYAKLLPRAAIFTPAEDTIARSDTKKLLRDFGSEL